MKPHERTTCYLCGVLLDGTNRTRDHVPPRGLFPRPLVDPLLLVPCCRSCNNGKSKEEEFFRLIACLGLNQTPEKTALYEQRVLPRTLGRGRLKAEIAGLLSKMDNRWTKMNGVFVNAGLLRIPKAPLKRVAERTARGLLAYLQPTLDVHQLDFHAFLPPREAIWEALASVGGGLQELRLGGRAFHAYHGTAKDNPSAGMFLMNFHETIATAVFHFDEGAESRRTGPEIALQ